LIRVASSQRLTGPVPSASLPSLKHFLDAGLLRAYLERLHVAARCASMLQCSNLSASRTVRRVGQGRIDRGQ